MTSKEQDNKNGGEKAKSNRILVDDGLRPLTISIRQTAQEEAGQEQQEQGGLLFNGDEEAQGRDNDANGEGEGNDSPGEEESQSSSTENNKMTTGPSDDPKPTTTDALNNVVPPPLFLWTFHIETIRFLSSIALGIVIAVGYVITNHTSDINEHHPPDETVIAELFGFNHSCNLVDHNPARMVAAILIPLYQYPMIFYVILFHCRLTRSVRDGSVPNWLLTFSWIISPYNILAFSQLHLWFVNNPDDDYGFVAHYIPYVMFQVAIALTFFLNVQYLIYKDNLPCRVPVWAANLYQILLFMLMVIFYTIMVCTVLTDNPVLDMKNNDTHKLIAQTIVAIFGAWIIFGPILFSAIERRDGDVNTLTYG